MVQHSRRPAAVTTRVRRAQAEPYAACQRMVRNCNLQPSPPDVDGIEARGALSAEVCRDGSQGICAKPRDAVYDAGASAWINIKNPKYSPSAERHERSKRLRLKSRWPADLFSGVGDSRSRSQAHRPSALRVALHCTDPEFRAMWI